MGPALEAGQTHDYPTYPIYVLFFLIINVTTLTGFNINI